LSVAICPPFVGEANPSHRGPFSRSTARYGFRVDIADIADVTVVDVLVVVVQICMTLSPEAEGPAKPLHLAIAEGVERCLQLDVELSGADTAAVHRAQDLDVTDRVETEALGDTGLHQFDNARYGGFRIVCRHQIEVTGAFRLPEIGDRTLIDLVGVDNGLALRGLPEHLCEPHYRYSTRSDDVCQDYR